jgi:hypothetical protein
MLSYIDPILFPDECEVLEIAPGHCVYNIFLNGSSSLRESGFRTLSLQEVAQLDRVEVYIREPFDRYVGGVQKYLNDLGDDYDRDTVLRMIREFLFLNRHFSLQFHWLVNLRRHCNPDITIRPLRDLGFITPKTVHVMPRDPGLIDYFRDHDRLWYYLQIDKVLHEELIGQTLKFRDIVDRVKSRCPQVYQDVIQRSQQICSVLD